MPINSFLYPGAKVVPVFTVANSLRFNDGDSHYLTRTNSSTGSTSKSTISLWIKRGVLGTYQDIFESYSNNDNYFRFRFRDDDKMDLQSDISNSTVFLRRTTRVFRDPSAWMHICVKIDLTQSNSDKIKLFINGTQETTFDSSTDLTSSSQQFVGAGGGYNFTIGRHPSDAAYFDGYMAEYVFIDGQALDPTSFGEYDDDTPNVWKPIDVSGLTFGTNGFYLDFEDSSALGNDVSGNNNDFSSSGLAATDQSTDTCTNNYITLNPINADLSNSTLTEGNLQFAGGDTSVNYDYVAATIAPSAGKWYWEVKAVDNAEIDQVGVAEADLAIFSNASNSSGLQATTYGGKSVQFSNGNKAGDGSQSSYMGGFSANDIMMIALDLDNGNIYYGRNGQWANGSGGADQSFPGTAAFTNLTAGAAYVPAHCMRAYGGSNTGESEYNFGSPPYSISSGNTDGNGYGNFEYSVPSNYYAINTKNLAEFG